MKTARIAKVKFRDASTTRGRGAGVWREYTYLLPESATDVQVGDTIIVPVGDYGLTRRAQVIEIDDLNYKYAIGKVQTF